LDAWSAIAAEYSKRNGRVHPQWRFLQPLQTQGPRLKLGHAVREMWISHKVRQSCSEQCWQYLLSCVHTLHMPRTLHLAFSAHSASLPRPFFWVRLALTSREILDAARPVMSPIFLKLNPSSNAPSMMFLSYFENCL
jgi:hypothetical protein